MLSLIGKKVVNVTPSDTVSITDELNTPNTVGSLYIGTGGNVVVLPWYNGDTNSASTTGVLGAIAGTNGFIYLDKTYTIQDSSTNALSYNNKKFLINRLTSTPYLDETSQIQLLEITMVDMLMNQPNHPL